MIEFIQKYWEYILAFGTVVAYLFEKGRTIWLDTKKKKTACNRVFTGILKLYFSYIKHKSLYAEKSPMNLPDEIYAPMLKYLDTFNLDIEEFKSTVNKETEIIPEITIQTHLLFDIVDRLRVMDRMKSDGMKEIQEITEQETIAVKKAQFYSLEEFFNEFFTDIISDVQKHTTVKKSFINKLQFFDSQEYLEEAEIEQNKIMKRYLESLNRQGFLPNNDFNNLLIDMKIK